MIAGLDSSFDRPTPAQVAQASAAGVRVWGGYLATRPNVGLAAPWDLASFDAVRPLGGVPLAFCSGWDDPTALRTLAQQWAVRLCLDVEDRIRPDGTWVDPFLGASGAGLYGLNSPLGSVHYHAAAFHVGAYYPSSGDPGATWFGPRPADGAPCAWQWQDTHPEFGLSVDRGWYDDWFGGSNVTLNEKQAFVRLAYSAFLWHPPATADRDYWVGQLADDGSNLDAILATIEDSTEGNQLKALRARLLAWALTGSAPPAGAATATHTHPQTVTHTGPPDVGT